MHKNLQAFYPLHPYSITEVLLVIFMEEEQFKQLLRTLRLMEIEDRGRADAVHLENMDLTDEQKKILADEFGAKHHSVQRTAPSYFETLGF